MDFNGILALIIILALTVGLFFRQLTKWRDSESTSRTDDASGEENEALRRDSESTSRTDHGSGEENKTLDPLVIEHKGSDMTDHMKEKASSEAIPSMETKPAFQYDVFLSFCGRDTRLTFTDHLWHRMRDAGICVFLDSEELKHGERICKVLEAVDESQIYIPIFSPNFASRPWCLREVARMVERHSKSDGKREIIPIFYEVEAKDVKLRTNLYKDDILKHKGKFGSKELEQWTRALKEVGRIMGRELKGKRQGEQIESIVKEVLCKLNGKHVNVPGYLVEDYLQIKAIIEKLDLNSGGVRFVGIHGIGGIGKTTLAKVVFKKLSSHFERVSFLDDIRKSSERGLDGLVTLQKKLLRNVGSSLRADQIKNVGDGMYNIKAVCKTKKVLIVLDDLDTKEQLEMLAGKSDWFGSDSRIIITTRDERILMTEVESSSKEDRNQPKGILCYAVCEMEFDLALQLFYKHAFRSDSPIEDYVALSKDIVCKVAKLPLAIEVIGSYLYDLGSLNPRGDHKKLWKETLKKLDEGPFKGVRDILIISYKGLEDKEKEVFLDIACFFINEDKTYPVIMWDDHNYYPETAICILCLRSLIKIIDNKFWMHDQVRDLGRYIVLKEHTPKFSRVWKHEDVVELLEKKKGNEYVEALSLTSDRGHNFRDELAALPKLRFLRAKSSIFSGDFKNLLPELRWLTWQAWKMTFDAKNFHFSKLVVLNLSNSLIEDDWCGWSQMKMDRLKILDLTGCIGLKKTPNFSNFMSLEKLILAGCVKLTTIDSSIGKLKHLTTLNIKGCGLLGELPEEVGDLQSLTEVIMPQTFQPFNLPEKFGNLESLSTLILDEHLGISQLPRYIGGLVKVTRLSLHCCVGIKMLPSTLGKMKMLVELDLSMSGIVELPGSIEYLKKLKVIRVSYTMIRKFPDTIGQVEMLEELHAKKCWDLTDENLKEIGKLFRLKKLDLSYTNVSIFPEELGCLSHLQNLKLGSSDLQEVLKLPSSLTHLHMQARQFPSNLDLSSLFHLRHLELSRLTVSREETDPSWTNNLIEKQPIHPLPCELSTLKCRGIRLLPPLSELTQLSVLCVIEYPMPNFSISPELTNLTELKLSKCKFIEKIYGLPLLKNLQRLEINRLDRLTEIQGLSELESLLYFRISDCYTIERLPALSKLDKLQHIELEACPKIKVIEGIAGLESLLLDNRGCIVLERLLDVSRSTWLSHKNPECQVFLSFSGSDTSYNIVDVLYKNLVYNQILVFRDDDILSSGDGINERHPQALDDSLIYIPFLSKNYASSWWCLRELAHMVNCTSKSDGKKIILPIFYGVEVDDVWLESPLYRSALDKHRCNFGDEVEEWEMALREVAKRRGFNLNSNSSGELIESVVEEVSRRLRGRHVDVPEHLIEDHSQIKEIIDKLDVDSGGVRFVVIHGMGGIGKTTLAKVVFNKLLLQFDGVSFLQNVRESSQHSLDGLVNLQKELLSSVLGSRATVQIKDISDGVDQIMKVCGTKKVLIVLDDLDKNQLQKLAGNLNWFGLGSRIIITTRDKNILMPEVVLHQPTESLAYEVHEMEFGQARQLFCQHAFGRDSAMEGYGDLAEKIVLRVGMLPLAVEVIGRHLHNAVFRLEQDLCDKKLWKDTLELLDGGLKVVQDSLMISYQGLENSQKEIFLDIACFFIDEDVTYPVTMWDDCNYDPHNAIKVLLQRSLIKIRDNKFWMHNQLRDLGRHIIHEEYPSKFSRVWIEADAVKLLREKGNEDVKALSLTSDGCSRCFGPQKPPALPNLRFLRVKGIDFFSNFENLFSQLRWLSWQTCRTTLQVNNFHMSNLVVLDLSNSDIEDGWGGWSQMKIIKLKVLDLKDCIRLKTTPDFSNFTSLEKLILSRCVELTTIHNSIGKLNLLKTLNIKGCSSLGELPAEIGSLESLTEIIMPQNIQPFKLPETFGDLQSLSSLILDKHPGISQLPNSIGGLVKVKRLSLHCCVGIKKLPCSIGKMKMLEELDLSKSGIVELPDSIGCLKVLKVIRVNYTVIRKFPCTIGEVDMLEELHAKKCWDLMDENLDKIEKLSHLRILDLSYTEVSEFSVVRGCFSSLQTLEMSSSHLPEVRHLPPSLTRLHLQAHHFPSTLHFTSLANLDYLELSRLTASMEERSPTWTSDSPEEQLIHSLPSGLSTLKFRGISLLPPLSNLERLSVLWVIEYPMSGFSVSKNLIHLKELKLSKCKFVSCILGLSLLKNLERLDLNRLENLCGIDDLSKLESLSYFRISHCPLIRGLPNLSKLDKLGHIELVACPKITFIEGLKTSESRGLKWFELERSRRFELDNCGCTILKRVVDVSTWTWQRVPKNQVFLSFTRLDTCYSIVDSLFKNLVENQFSVFSYDEEPSSGDGIGEELPLDDSNNYIPILSKNYASSQWCLRELAHMVKSTSKSNGRKKILPIFYDVEIDDVKLDSDLYKSALAKHRRKFGNEVDEWEKALREVAGMRGLNLKAKSCGEKIDWVVDEVMCELNAKEVVAPKYSREAPKHMEAVIELLDVDSGGVRFIGILGTGVDGDCKTTLAMLVFNELSSHFDVVSFLNNVGESLRHDLINLQKKLLSSFVGSVIADQDDRVVMDRIKRVCETRKVLIVLDNIDKIEQLQMLAGKFDWFGSGSRIIFTTADPYIMGTSDYSSGEEDQKQTEGIIIHKLFEWDIEKQRELFYKYAFGGGSPIQGYEYLAKQIFRRVHGHPLLVEVIGSYLYSYLEPHGDKRRLWEDTLKQLEEGPLKNVQDALMISYEALNQKQKEVFLDIACFFTDKDQTYPVIMWEACDYDPDSAIPVLIQRSLIKVNDNKFWMHYLIRNLGRDIQKKYPRKVSRGWDLEEVLKLMERKERNEDLKALSVTSCGNTRNFAPNQLTRLPNLRFLHVKGFEFSGNFDNHLLELRWLSWQVRLPAFLATNFHFSKLVVLDLSNSNIEDGWGGWSQMKMDSLKVLDLTSCKRLKSTPDFSNFLTLEMLILARCVNLTTIGSSIGKLTHLRTLNLEGCSSFGELPAEISSLQDLKEIVMPPKVTDESLI